MGKFKLLGCLMILMLLIGCGRRVEDENLSDSDLVGGIIESDNTSMEYECAHVEGDEEVSIYDRCWSDVRNTREGRAFIERYREELNRGFPGWFTKDPTFGELQEAFERVLETCEIEITFDRERKVCDSTAFLEVAGVEVAVFWQRTERMNHLLDEARDIFVGGRIGYGALLTFFEESLETDMSDITIDDLERAVRRSVEDGVDYILEALRNDKFIDPMERDQD